MKLIRRYAIAITLALLALVMAAVLYPQLPARVPVHWSATGAVNAWMPKSIGVFLLPVIALAVVVLLIFHEPENFREPQAGSIHWIYPAMVAVFSGFMLYVTILMLFAGMGMHFAISVYVTVGIGILFAVTGASLGKVPPNRRVGLRFRWTLSNREVWSRTHRLAGWLFTLGGLGTAALALITRSPSSAIYGMAVLLGLALLAALYSFIVSRRLKHNGISGD